MTQGMLSFSKGNCMSVLLFYFGIFVKNQVVAFVWTNIWVLYSIPLDFLLFVGVVVVVVVVVFNSSTRLSLSL